MAIGRAILLIVGLAIVFVVVALVVIYSGIYNVAANYPEKTPIAWVLSTTKDSSVKRHAKNIKVPSDLNDPAMIKAGLSHYRGMCVECHGAPGVKIGEVGRGLNPLPPELTEAASEWTPSELFWITKNGVRMSGMPAWGVTHSDKVIWEMVSFMKKLPSMSPTQYKTMSKQTPQIKEQ